MQVLGNDGSLPDTTMTEVVYKHFSEASTVLGLMRDSADVQKRRMLTEKLTALRAAKNHLPV